MYQILYTLSRWLNFHLLWTPQLLTARLELDICFFSTHIEERNMAQKMVFLSFSKYVWTWAPNQNPLTKNEWSQHWTFLYSWIMLGGTLRRGLSVLMMTTALFWNYVSLIRRSMYKVNQTGWTVEDFEATDCDGRLARWNCWHHARLTQRSGIPGFGCKLWISIIHKRVNKYIIYIYIYIFDMILYLLELHRRI